MSWRGEAIANVSLPCSRMVVLARWAAITDQRRDVLDLRRGEVLRILRGDARDWSEFGGSPQPISVYLPASQAGAIAAGLRIPLSELAADLLPDDEADGPRRSYAGRVRADRARAAAARAYWRSRSAATTRTATRRGCRHCVCWAGCARPRPPTPSRCLRRPGSKSQSPFDPAGMLVTGELIPVRCTNHVLAALDDYGAMFDGVRDSIVAADIAVAPLESALTDLGGPTPCVETLDAAGQSAGRARAVRRRRGRGADDRQPHAGLLGRLLGRGGAARHAGAAA